MKRGTASCRPALIAFECCPPYLQDNEYIKHHYRADWSIVATAASFLRLHNETFNIWSHFVGFLLFLGLTIHMALGMTHPRGPDGSIVSADAVARWPFYVFLAGAMICLCTSTVCHWFCCVSQWSSSLIWRFDYAGIAALITCSFYPMVYYNFLCQPGWRNFYLGVTTALGVGAQCVSLLSRFQSRRFRPLRAGLFSALGLWGLAPLSHSLLWAWKSGPPPEVMRCARLEGGMGAAYLIGAFVYATRLPERLLPGKFDLAFSSHNLFHVFVVAGAYLHYHAAMVSLKWRDGEVGCDPSLHY